jgi:O-succinylbenzoate synthase
VTAVAGRVTVPTGPGIGHEVLAERITRDASRVFDSATAEAPEIVLTAG